jgi:hypothetical protein
MSPIIVGMVRFAPRQAISETLYQKTIQAEEGNSDTFIPSRASFVRIIDSVSRFLSAVGVNSLKHPGKVLLSLDLTLGGIGDVFGTAIAHSM